MQKKEVTKLHALSLGIKCYLSQFPIIYVTEYVLVEKQPIITLCLLTYFSRSCVFIKCVEISITSEILNSLLKHTTNYKAQRLSCMDTVVAMVFNIGLTV